MTSVAAELKRRQLAAVERDVIAACAAPLLNGLAEQLDGPGVWGVTPAELAEAEAAQVAWGAS
jgi:hypothetical protein